ncbi:MAG: tRNA 2-thiouridine(34) synthase MnmA [bacterium]|nr:tRNA 2-thiouridine(34) synthase MnmA [bacterium]
MFNRKLKILVCMSGGVDSSVAAALLVEQGYDVTGAFMVNYEDGQLSPPARGGVAEGRGGGSCWRDDYRDALRVAAKLGIKLLRLNFVKEYNDLVLSYMYREYEAGRTPNPDVMCNKFIKFGFWLDKARELGYDYIATGHYARVTCHSERSPQGAVEESLSAECMLLQAKDENKDQTYFLNQLTQAQLAHTMFPIGDYTKTEVRALAKKFDLPTAAKEESMGICFIGEVPMKEFLEKKIKKNPGKIVLSDGTSVGDHDGLAFYTIGERVGGLSFRAERSAVEESLRVDSKGFLHSPRGSVGMTNNNTKPLFIIAKNTDTNELVVGHDDDQLLFKQVITVSEINWISGQTPKFPLKCEVRLRHRQPLRPCVVSCHSRENGNLPQLSGSSPLSFLRKQESYTVNFTTPERAPTPGQFAVFYQDGVCLGGGVIE